jgi:hypothetical protein
MTKQQKVNIIGKQFGSVVAKTGLHIWRNSYNFKPVIYDRLTIKNFLKEQIPTYRGSSLFDIKYYLTNWRVWQDFIKYDWTEQKKYLADIADCDNMAFHFACFSNAILKLNSGGVACGNIYEVIYDPVKGIERGQKLERHCFNIIPVFNETLQLYLLEPQTDCSTLFQKDKDNYLEKPNWIFLPDWVYMW